MRVEFVEHVLRYRREQLEAWERGDRSLVPESLRGWKMFETQQARHFGEVLVLRHFERNGGWTGFNDYALDWWEPNVERHDEGRYKVEEIVPPEKLRTFRTERRRTERGRKGFDEPDLFLFRGTEFMFVEVKKERDVPSKEQLVCLAQVRALLECEARIIYLAEERQAHRPRTWAVDVDLPQKRVACAPVIRKARRPDPGT